MAEHLREVYPEYASPEQPEGDLLPFKVWQSARIDRAEELALGIPETLIPRPFTRFVAQDVMAESRGEKRSQGSSHDTEPKRGRRRVQ